MYKVVKFSVVLFSLALLNGCASSCGGSVGDDSKEEVTNKVVVPKRAENAKVPSNTNTKIVNGLQKANGVNPTLDNSKVKKIDTSKVKTKPQTKKLADNSEVSVRSVGASFVETRTYKSHPQLEKVEKIINGKDVKYKVYLKDGKAPELDKSKIKDFRKAMAADFLKAVGVKPAEVKNKQTKENAEEMKEKASKATGKN